MYAPGLWAARLPWVSSLLEASIPSILHGASKPGPCSSSEEMSRQPEGLMSLSGLPRRCVVQTTRLLLGCLQQDASQPHVYLTCLTLPLLQVIGTHNSCHIRGPLGGLNGEDTRQV